MDLVLERLKEGIRRFQTEVYPARVESYERAMREPQKPGALVIACADSRIQPDILTQSKPGEIFVTRNIGNMVPVHKEPLEGVSAVLEFAVAGLGVRHIVVCGHSGCGAMKALLDPGAVNTMPAVQAWLQHAHAAPGAADAPQAPPEDDAASLRRLTEQNILLQMQHVRTHPAVAAAIARGEVTISGWYYDIAQGEVFVCEADSLDFKPVSLEKQAT